MPQRTPCLTPLVLALLLAGVADRAGAVGACPPAALCFDDLLAGSATSAASFPGVAIDDGLVLSEDDVELLLGFEATGTWATSGEQGLLNTLTPAIRFDFAVPVASFAASVLGLPGSGGAPQVVVVQAWSGNLVVALDVSNTALLGDSGLHEDELAVAEASGITRVVVFPGVPCAGLVCYDVGSTTSFWLDSVRLGAAVPEPGAAALLAPTALGAAFAAARRRRRARLAKLAVLALAVAACVPKPAIVAPADGSDLGSPDLVAVQVALGAPLPPGGWLRAALLTRIDSPPARRLDVSDRFAVSGDTATAELAAADLSNGRNALFVNVDADGDGISETVVSSTFRWSGLMAAACAKPITPLAGVNHSDPVFMAGFGNDRTPCQVGEVAPPEENCQFGPVHDELWARGMVLESGDTKLAIVTLDVVGYFYNEVQTIRSLVDPALGFDSITVTSTHNHEGPDTMGLWGPDETTTGTDLGYLDFVNDQAVACIEEANASLVPAEIKHATGSTLGASLPPWPDLVADGRVLQAMTIPAQFLTGATEDLVVQGDPGPITNPSVPALQVRVRGGGPVIATALNFASHPESLADDNRSLTADFPHYARQYLEAAYGGIAIHVSADLGVLQGPLSVDVLDPLTGQPAPSRSFRKAEIMGTLLGERTAQALDASAAWEQQPEIAAWSSGPLQVEVENPFFVVLGEVFNIFGRRALTSVGQTRFIQSEVQLLRLGAAQMVATPNELDPQIGNVYRAALTSAQHKWLLGLANDEIGYQMPAAKFVPGCFECVIYVFGDILDFCPFVSGFYSLLPPPQIGVCDTIFQNNVGPGADPQLQAEILDLIGQANP